MHRGHWRALADRGCNSGRSTPECQRIFGSSCTLMLPAVACVLAVPPCPRQKMEVCGLEAVAGGAIGRVTAGRSLEARADGGIGLTTAGRTAEAVADIGIGPVTAGRTLKAGVDCGIGAATAGGTPELEALLGKP